MSMGVVQACLQGEASIRRARSLFAGDHRGRPPQGLFMTLTGSSVNMSE